MAWHASFEDHLKGFQAMGTFEMEELKNASAVDPSQDGWPMGMKKPAEELAPITVTAGSLPTLYSLTAIAKIPVPSCGSGLLQRCFHLRI